MTHTLQLYGGKNYTLAKDLSGYMVSPEWTTNQGGSLDGTVKVKITADNKSFLQGLRENSHFVYASTDNKSFVGGVIDSAWPDIDNQNRQIYSLHIIGFKEYLAKIIAISSNKAGAYDSNTEVQSSDISGIMNHYSDCPEGVLLSTLTDLEAVMNHYGYNRFWDYGNLEDTVVSVNTTSWKATYRLNSLEVPTYDQILGDILGDQASSLMHVEPNVSGGTFSWVLNFTTANHSYTMVEKVDKLGDITFQEPEQLTRSYSFMTGTTLTSQNLISQIPMNSGVAWSGMTADNPADQTKTLAPANQDSITKNSNLLGQATFTSFESDKAKLFDVVTISGEQLEPFSMVITQIALSDRKYTYSGNVIASTAGPQKGAKPANLITKLVLNPLFGGANRSRKTSFQKDGTTGWRQRA